MNRAVAAWERFWFVPEETSTLAVFRIVFGALVLLWTLTLTHDAQDFFSPGGVLPDAVDYDALGQRGIWSASFMFESEAGVMALMAVLAAAAVCLMIGYRTRIAAVIVFVCIVSLERRNLFVFNSGDGLLKIMAFWLVLAPAGASLSVDRLRTARERFWEFPRRAPWALRMLQIQLSLIYVSTVWAKVRGTTWDDGTAVSYALRVDDLTRLPVPLAIANSELIVNFLTFGTLAVEFALGFLVWSRRARPWVLLLGVGLHLGIDYSIRVGFFSYAMLALYLTFIPPETAGAWLLKLRERVSRSPGAGAPKKRPWQDEPGGCRVAPGGGSRWGLEPPRTQLALRPQENFPDVRPCGRRGAGAHHLGPSEPNEAEAQGSVGIPTSGIPSSGIPTSGIPTSGIPTSGLPTTGIPTTGIPTTGIPTPASPPPASRPPGSPPPGSRPPAFPPRGSPRPASSPAFPRPASLDRHRAHRHSHPRRRHRPAARRPPRRRVGSRERRKLDRQPPTPAACWA